MPFNTRHSRGGFNGQQRPQGMGRGGGGAGSGANSGFVFAGQYKTTERPLIQMPNNQQQSTPPQAQRAQGQNQWGGNTPQSAATPSPAVPGAVTPAAQKTFPAAGTPAAQKTFPAAATPAAQKTFPAAGTPAAQKTFPAPPTIIQQQVFTPLKSIIKQSKPPTEMQVVAPPPPTVVDHPETEADLEMMDTSDGSSEKTARKSWKTGSKLTKKERKERRNKRIGKLVRPKNAIMVLNELCGGPALKFSAIGMQNGLFGISVTVDGQAYEAYANTENGAKHKVSEHALKGYIANKVRARQQLRFIKEDDADDTKIEEEPEDVSWCHLASFALFKLMDSWQDIGDIMPAESSVQKAAHKTNPPKAAKGLPANASEIHPVMLLHQMRPGIVIEDVSCTGQTPHIIHTVRIDFDGDEVFGQGPNKKQARKNCAQTVMEKHFNVVYPVESKQEVDSTN